MSKRNRERRERNREARLHPPRRDRRRLGYVVAGGAVAALLAASFVVPPLLEEDPVGAAASHGAGHAQAQGDGPDVGVPAPAFAERDVTSGKAISTETIAGRKTLLFFSEGVMCQACFEQIRDLEQMEDGLAQRGIRLIGVTPDPPDVLRQVIPQLGIRTAMIADDDRDMSAAFDTLGRGMHPDTPGHAFVLVGEDGTVVWQRDYWLEPWQTMYVEPERLLADLAAR